MQQSVGDQVTALVSGLEREHLAALIRVDELNATNASIVSENDAVKSANATLEKQLADRSDALSSAEKQMADALDMVETVAAAALAMLRATKRPDGQPAADPIVATAIAAEAATLAARPALVQTPPAPPRIVDVLVTDDMLKLAPVAITTAAVEIAPTAPVEPSPPIVPSFAEQAAADVMTNDAPVASDTGAATEEKPIDPTTIREALDKLAVVLQPAIAAPAVEVSAVDRMHRATSDMLPAPTLNAAYDGPTLVIHNDGNLPSYLARDTNFDNGQIFS